MFTRDLEMCLMAAQSEAKDRHHEYLCVEHILYALLHHDTGIRIIKSCGGKVDRIKQDLEEFFSQQETVGDDNSPQQGWTHEFRQIGPFVMQDSKAVALGAHIEIYDDSESWKHEGNTAYTGIKRIMMSNFFM